MYHVAYYEDIDNENTGRDIGMPLFSFKETDFERVVERIQWGSYNSYHPATGKGVLVLVLEHEQGIDSLDFAFKIWRRCFWSYFKPESFRERKWIFQGEDFLEIKLIVSKDDDFRLDQCA